MATTRELADQARIRIDGTSKFRGVVTGEVVVDDRTGTEYIFCKAETLGELDSTTVQPEEMHVIIPAAGATVQSVEAWVDEALVEYDARVR